METKNYRDKNSHVYNILKMSSRYSFSFDEALKQLLYFDESTDEELKGVPLEELEQFYEEVVAERKDELYNINYLINRCFVKTTNFDNALTIEIVQPIGTVDYFQVECDKFEILIQGTNQQLITSKTVLEIEEIQNKELYKEINNDIFSIYQQKISNEIFEVKDELFNKLIVDKK